MMAPPAEPRTGAEVNPVDRRIVAIALVITLSAPLAVMATDPGMAEEPFVGTSDAMHVEGHVQDTSTYDEHAAMSELVHVKNIESGRDIRGSRIVDGILYSVGHSGFYVHDVTDPENPVRLFHTFCPGRDIAVSGGFAVIMREGGYCAGSGQGAVVFDVTNPSSPKLKRSFWMPTHTVAAIGDTGIFHVASQVLTPYTQTGLFSGRSGQQEMIDTRSGTPTLLSPFRFPTRAENGDPVNAPSCHEFYYAEELARGYCAGVVETHIWDMTNPVKPKILSVIKNPNISIHHSARPNHDGTLLIINDEEGGALVPACHTATLGRAPRGALWFYDTGAIAGSEDLPLLVSWLGIPSPVSAGIKLRCTSHYGEVLPNNHQAVWSWYGAGVVLIDFSDPLLPTVLDSFVKTGRDSWGANLDGTGYAISGDMQQGIDVYRLA